jgi:hypothetical protein
MSVMGLAEFIALGSVVVALCALGVSILAIKSARDVSKAERAAEAIRQYLDLALKYPRFSTDQKDEDYQWFISYVLLMAQEVLGAYPNNPRWRELMKKQLGYHHKYLSDWDSEDRSFFDLFGPTVAALVREIVTSKAAV